MSGRPKVYSEPRVSTGLRLPKSLHERILVMADERDVSANWLITRAIERYVEAESTVARVSTDTEDVPAAEALGRLLPDGREITHCHTVLGRVIEMRCASGGPSVPINDDGTVTVLVGPNTSL